MLLIMQYINWNCFTKSLNKCRGYDINHNINFIWTEPSVIYLGYMDSSHVQSWHVSLTFEFLLIAYYPYTILPDLIYFVQMLYFLM